MYTTYLKLKLVILSKLIWLWDVFFTFVDNKQLSYWSLLKSRISDTEEELLNRNKYGNLDVEEHESWEDI